MPAKRRRTLQSLNWTLNSALGIIAGCRRAHARRCLQAADYGTRSRVTAYRKCESIARIALSKLSTQVGAFTSNSLQEVSNHRHVDYEDEALDQSRMVVKFVNFKWDE
jgi:hypothetical protein